MADDDHVGDAEMELACSDDCSSESSEGSPSDDETADPSNWLPALQASARLRQVAWRAEALPELALLRLSLSDGAAGSAGDSGDADAPTRHVAVGQGPGRLALFIDACAPSAVLCAVDPAMPPCLWVPLGRDDEGVAAELARLEALYPFSARDAPPTALWAARPPATASPDPRALLARSFIGGAGMDGFEPLGSLFQKLLETGLVVSGDSVADVVEAATAASPTTLLEIELRGLASGAALWLHELDGLRALSTERVGGGGAVGTRAAGAGAVGACAEVIDSLNAELGTCLPAQTPLELLAAVLRAGVRCVSAAELREATAAQAAEAEGGGGSDGGAAEVASTLHVLHFIRAPGLLDDLAAAAQLHARSETVCAAVAVLAPQVAADGTADEAAAAAELLRGLASAEREPQLAQLLGEALAAVQRRLDDAAAAAGAKASCH
jgi:hypothetical protein